MGVVAVVVVGVVVVVVGVVVVVVVVEASVVFELEVVAHCTKTLKTLPLEASQ